MDRGEGGRAMRVQGFSPHTHSDIQVFILCSLPLCWTECLRIRKEGGWTRGPQDWDWDWDWTAQAGLDYNCAFGDIRLDCRKEAGTGE